MSNEKPLVNKKYLLQKFEGKGGWTYAQIPEILQDKHAHFGWVRVKGTIDNYEIKNYNLMPMGNGKLFLPVKAEIRKKINKQAGDYVQVTLFADNLPTELTEELRLCMLDVDGVLEKFLSFTKAQQKACISWIYAAKTEEVKISRINKTIASVINGQKLAE